MEIIADKLVHHRDQSWQALIIRPILVRCIPRCEPGQSYVRLASSAAPIIVSVGRWLTH